MGLQKVYTTTNASICSPNSCKYRFASLQTVFGNHEEPPLAPNATCFFLGWDVFHWQTKTHEAEVVWILVVFCFSSRDTIPSSRSFLSFHFCEGNELHPGSHQKGFKGPRKTDLHQTRCSLCELKVIPTQISSRTIFTCILIFKPSHQASVLLLECTIVSGMSEDPGTREHPTYYCWAMPPIHIIYIYMYIYAWNHPWNQPTD